ncbi:hypothetical protein AACH28_14785 [Sphingobacterium thalpophilum]|uniref:Uncharacterized protein n=1 Tax=Sphingobacterium thalpophilum TaxID=259 RepID=A0ACD5BWX1_9SPHI
MIRYWNTQSSLPYFWVRTLRPINWIASTAQPYPKIYSALKGYALIDGKRSVYINIAKAGNASTLDVVNTLKKQLPDIQRNMPDDVKISYEFDQSVYLSMP